MEKHTPRLPLPPLLFLLAVCYCIAPPTSVFLVEMVACFCIASPVLQATPATSAALVCFYPIRNCTVCYVSRSSTRAHSHHLHHHHHQHFSHAADANALRTLIVRSRYGRPLLKGPASHYVRTAMLEIMGNPESLRPKSRKWPVYEGLSKLWFLHAR